MKHPCFAMRYLYYKFILPALQVIHRPEICNKMFGYSSDTAQKVMCPEYSHLYNAWSGVPFCHKLGDSILYILYVFSVC